MGDRKYETVGIICAMAKEVTLLEKTMTESSRETVSGVEYISGTMEVSASCSRSAASARFCRHLRTDDDFEISSGRHPECRRCGSLTEGLHIGDIAIADKVVQHDMDTSPVGDPFGLISGINRFTCRRRKASPRYKECVEECAGAGHSCHDRHHRVR